MTDGEGNGAAYDEPHGKAAFESAAGAEALPDLLDATIPDIVAGHGVGAAEDLLQLSARRGWFRDSRGERGCQPLCAAGIVEVYSR
jgi:hypothetical protein